MAANTLNSRLSVADLCRENGWTVGTRLAGNEGYGFDVIEITAIGQTDFMARTIERSGMRVHEDEHSWVLYCRDWREVGAQETKWCDAAPAKDGKVVARCDRQVGHQGPHEAHRRGWWTDEMAAEWADAAVVA